ncbi:MAG TPA: sigma-70 family RNA polymerase sigma factor [Polyangiaceae bacterium]|nr:sigma-70 family RNA polymerase sigma factor [Polyangiaceae bacterium]
MFSETIHTSCSSRNALTAPEPVDADAALLRGLLSDDPSAWRTFNTRYARLVYSCIARVMARFSAVTSGDDVREVYATLCVQLLANDKKKLRSFEASRGTKLGSWLGMLAVHAAYDHLRAVRRTPLYGSLVEAESMCGDEPSPFEQSLNRERAAHVTRLMDSLSDKDKLFFKLYFADGLTPETVADRMGISVKTVYSKKHKITAKLEALLSDCEPVSSRAKRAA